MKHNYLFKSLLTGLLLATGTFANAQSVHPVTYSYDVSGTQYNNSFLDYVGTSGERFVVTYHPAVAGPKVFTTPNTGDGATGTWGGYPSGGLIIPNDTVLKYSVDSCMTTPLAVPANYFKPNGVPKIALLYRGAGVQFGQKALAAQGAGASACVIVNNVDGGPVGMAAGTYGPSVTIPVFMIGKADGDALNAQLWAGDSVVVNVGLWGFLGNLNDLGLVDGGIAQWHNGAIPGYELLSGGNPMPYQGFDGAYVANFGTADAYDVTLTASTSFTPTGGSEATFINYDSVRLGTFLAADSVWGMFAPSYNLEALLNPALSSAGGTGTLNVTYNVYQTNSLTDTGYLADQFPPDNTASYSVDITANVYCKGRWDAANNRPFCSFYTGPGAATAGVNQDYLWGPCYYINVGRVADSVTFSEVAAGTTLDSLIPSSSTYIYLLKWVDGSVGGVATYSPGGVMVNEALELAGIGLKTFDGAHQASFGYFTVAITDSNGINPGTIQLDSNSWYWLAPDMPQNGGSTTFSIGLDGINNGFPRLYGRDTFNTPPVDTLLSTGTFSYIEYYQAAWIGGGRGYSIGGGTGSGSTPMDMYPNTIDAAVPFAGIGDVNMTGLDSIIFSSTKGFIPNVSLSTQMFPTKASSVKAEAVGLNLYPNPATTSINVALSLESLAKEVTYKVITTTGKEVSMESRSNVLNDVYTFNTNKLSSGVYYMIVTVDNRPMFRKFTVIH